uniref:Uncharacterized protein n=1 Tax=Leersia perrieri TaxID=77586 RepID=A0A0D9XFC7_9ORYZ
MGISSYVDVMYRRSSGSNLQGWAHAAMEVKMMITPGINPDLPDSWRCYPNLTFSIETLVFDGNLFNGFAERTRYFNNIVDQILQNHSGIGVMTLKFDLQDCGNIDSRHIDWWLHNALFCVMVCFTHASEVHSLPFVVP